MALSHNLLRLIQALAEDAARRDYLAAQAASDGAEPEASTYPVPLPATERAA